MNIASSDQLMQKMDLATDNIENNVASVSDDVRSAGGELTTAHESQRKAGRRMICLVLILVLVIMIVLVAVSDFLAAENLF